MAIFVAAIIRFFLSWLFVAIRGYSWLFVFRGYFFSRAWLFIQRFVAIRGYSWLSVAIPGYFTKK